MMSEKKIMGKNKKVIIAACIAALAAIAATAGILLHNPLDVKKDVFTVEYGQPISTDAADYLKKDVDQEVVKETKVTYKEDKAEGTDYDKCGEYLVTLAYKDKTAEVTVAVKDTTKPEFNATADAGIETIEGVELDFAGLVTASDLSGAEVSFDASGVDLNTAGEYVLKATAKDGAGNKTKKDIKVTVAAAPKNMSGSDVAVDPSTGKVTVTAKVQSKTSASPSGKGSGSSGSSSSSGSGGTGSNSISVKTENQGYINGESGNTWESSDWFDLPEGW